MDETSFLVCTRHYALPTLIASVACVGMPSSLWTRKSIRPPVIASAEERTVQDSCGVLQAEQIVMCESKQFPIARVMCVGVNRILLGRGPAAGGFAVLNPLPEVMWGPDTVFKLPLRKVALPTPEDEKAALQKEESKLPQRLEMATKHLPKRLLLDSGRKMQECTLEVCMRPSWELCSTEQRPLHSFAILACSPMALNHSTLLCTGKTVETCVPCCMLSLNWRSMHNDECVMLHEAAVVRGRIPFANQLWHVHEQIHVSTIGHLCVTAPFQKVWPVLYE